MRYIVTDLVKAEALKSFGREEAMLVISALESAELPFIKEGEAPERIHLAILYLAAGDLKRFDSSLRDAKIDWRDTLCMAGLENADWPAVLRKRGIDFRQGPDTERR